MKDLKTRIRAGETVLGCWLNLGHSLAAEIVGMAGFDWVLIDLEHGSGSEADVLHQLQALEHTGAAAFIRVESNSPQRVHRVLDFGAQGIMFPQIRRVQEAMQAAEAMRYQPQGLRGAARMVRATRFGGEFNAYYTDGQSRLVGIVQIETREILESLEAVAAIDGIDVLFIGPLDLSLALGTFGQPDHPRFLEALEATAIAARGAGKCAGILLPSIEEFTRYYDLGYRFIACGSDLGFLNSGARKMVEDLGRLRASSK